MVENIQLGLQRRPLGGQPVQGLLCCYLKTLLILDEIWEAGQLAVGIVDVASSLKIPCILSGQQNDGAMLQRIVGDSPMHGYCLMQSQFASPGRSEFFSTLEAAEAHNSNAPKSQRR